MPRARFLFGFWSAVLAIFVLGVGQATAAGDVLIATQALHKTLLLGDVAAGNAIGVDYQRGNHSFLRWSLDGGHTFAPEWPLRSGQVAKSPRLASCGNWMWASSLWRNSAGEPRTTIDYVDVTAPQSTSGHFRILNAFSADVACRGNVLAIAYSVSPVLMFAVMDGRCSDPCTPAYAAVISSQGDEPAKVAAVRDGFVVTWPDAGLPVQHFTVTGSGASIAVTPHPVVTVMPGINVYSPSIAGDGSRVVVAYTRRNDTHMRISDDYGKTFGPRIVVRNVRTDPCCAGSGADSVDARNGNILVEVAEGGGDPPGISMAGRLTRNNGATWKTTTVHDGGTQIGVLLAGVAAEAWDTHYYADNIYGNVPQRINFRITSLP